MNPDRIGILEQQVAVLAYHVRRLEEALRNYGIALQPERVQSPAPDPNSRQAEPPRQPESVARTQAEMPSLVFSQTGTPKDDRSVENRIGSQLFNRIGILAVLIGMAWFLKLAIDNHWIGPLGRVMIGLIAGGGFIAWSERFHSRGYEAFAYSLKAVGSGILYLSLWAAFSLFQLIPAGVAFGAMVLVTAFNGFLAWAQESELLALYAIAGGLSTPLLISTGKNQEVTLFGYLLILNIAVLVLVVLRPWSRLLIGAFLGTVFFFLGWWIAYYSDAQSAITAFFLSCFFLIFAFAPRMVRIGAEDNANPSPWDQLALVTIPIANAALAFIGFYGMFDRSGSAWSGPAMAVSFAAFYFVMFRLPPSRNLGGSAAILSGIHLAAAIVFLVIAIPLKTHGRWLTISWLAEGAALLWVAGRVQLRLLRSLALLCLALGFIALVAVNPAASDTPFLNERFGTYCVGIAVFAFAARMARKPQVEKTSKEPFSRPALAALALLIVNVLILLAISWEIHSYWWSIRWQGQIDLMRGYSIYAQFSYSAWLMTFGAILLATGFWRHSAFLRWQGLALLAVSIVKVFLLDMSELSQGYRVLSFLGLGGLLLAVSFAYQRDWFNLRVQRGRSS